MNAQGAHILTKKATEEGMLFGIDFCGRKCGIRRRRTGRASLARAALIAGVAALIAALLFLAPQWLLVVLVMGLTALVACLVCAK